MTIFMAGYLRFYEDDVNGKFNAIYVSDAVFYFITFR